MTYLQELTEAVRSIHTEIESQTGAFSKAANIHCIPGCNACCESSTIYVSVIDCLPIAQYIVENNLVDEVFSKLETQPYCPILESHGSGKGRCSMHPHRPSLCRLFGFAAMKTRRHDRDLVACKKIHAQIGDREIPTAPFVEEFSRQLNALDPVNGSETIPIRDAIALAIAKVGTVPSIRDYEESAPPR